MLKIKYKILCCQTTTSFYKVTTHVMCPVEQKISYGSNNLPRKEKHTCHVRGPNPFKTKANCNSINIINGKCGSCWTLWCLHKYLCHVGLSPWNKETDGMDMFDRGWADGFRNVCWMFYHHNYSHSLSL